MKRSVLFVDDETAVTDALRRMARVLDVDVSTANSGADALELLRKRPIDVVVSDERMPAMRGSVLLATVRREFPDTVRLVLSGEADLGAAVAAINEAEIFRFLLKPCPPEVLRAALAAAFEALDLQRKLGVWRERFEFEPNRASQRLDRALTTIEPAFQPIVSATDRSLHAMEALARLSDPDVRDPGLLFGLAEALERVPEVDRLIREKVAAVLARPEGPRRCFVNVHPDTLFSDVIHADDDPLHRFAERVVLEITERGAFENHHDLDARVATLRARGYTICLDDLGAGYSGLSAFARLRPTVVKFDMELVRGVHEDPVRAAMLASLTAMCRATGAMSVAEGIECAGEARCVQELGATLLQGYFIGRPQRGEPVRTPQAPFGTAAA